jgi:hypothetical protein
MVVNDGLLGVSWAVWGGACLLIAAVYTLVWPRPNQVACPPWRRAVLRWAHALVWLVLAVSCFLRGADPSAVTDAANALALLAAVLYLVFIASLALDRKARS